LGDEKRVVVEGGFEEEGVELEEMRKGFGSVDEGNGALRYPHSHLFQIPTPPLSTLHHFHHCNLRLCYFEAMDLQIWIYVKENIKSIIIEEL